MKVSKPVLIALVLSILVSLYILLFTGKKKTPAVVQQPMNIPAVNMQSINQPDPGQRTVALMKPVKTDFTWEKDPFFIARQQTEEIAIQLKLFAILESKKGRFAIINNQILKKGDTIGNEMVQEIKSDSVILIKKGIKRIVPIQEAFKEDSIKNKGNSNR